MRAQQRGFWSGNAMKRPRLNAKVIAIARQHTAFQHVSSTFGEAGVHFVGVVGLPRFTRDWSSWDAVLLFADGYSVERASRAAAGFAVRLVVVVTSELEAMREALWTRGTRSRVLVLQSPASAWTLVEGVRRGLPVSLSAR
jgi:hypothetical protein